MVMCMTNTCKVYTFYGCTSFHCDFTIYICSVFYRAPEIGGSEKRTEREIGDVLSLFPQNKNPNVGSTFVKLEL